MVVKDKSTLAEGNEGVCFVYRKYVAVEQLWVTKCIMTSDTKVKAVDKVADNGWKYGISTSNLVSVSQIQLTLKSEKGYKKKLGLANKKGTILKMYVKGVPTATAVDFDSATTISSWETSDGIEIDTSGIVGAFSLVTLLSMGMGILYLI